MHYLCGMRGAKVIAIVVSSLLLSFSAFADDLTNTHLGPVGHPLLIDIANGSDYAWADTSNEGLRETFHDLIRLMERPQKERRDLLSQAPLDSLYWLEGQLSIYKFPLDGISEQKWKSVRETILPEMPGLIREARLRKETLDKIPGGPGKAIELPEDVTTFLTLKDLDRAVRGGEIKIGKENEKHPSALARLEKALKTWEHSPQLGKDYAELSASEQAILLSQFNLAELSPLARQIEDILFGPLETPVTPIEIDGMAVVADPNEALSQVLPPHPTLARRNAALDAVFSRFQNELDEQILNNRSFDDENKKNMQLFIRDFSHEPNQQRSNEDYSPALRDQYKKFIYRVADASIDLNSAKKQAGTGWNDRHAEAQRRLNAVSDERDELAHIPRSDLEADKIRSQKEINDAEEKRSLLFQVAAKARRNPSIESALKNALDTSMEEMLHAIPKDKRDLFSKYFSPSLDVTKSAEGDLSVSVAFSAKPGLSDLQTQQAVALGNIRQQNHMEIDRLFRAAPFTRPTTWKEQLIWFSLYQDKSPAELVKTVKGGGGLSATGDEMLLIPAGTLKSFIFDGAQVGVKAFTAAAARELTGSLATNGALDAATEIAGAVLGSRAGTAVPYLAVAMGLLARNSKLKRAFGELENRLKAASKESPPVNLTATKPGESLESRLKRAAELPEVKRQLTAEEKKAIEEADKIGLGQLGKSKDQLAGVGDYSWPQLRQKAIVLKKAGFTPAQRRALFEAEIAGTLSPIKWFEALGLEWNHLTGALGNQAQYYRTLEGRIVGLENFIADIRSTATTNKPKLNNFGNHTDGNPIKTPLPVDYEQLYATAIKDPRFPDGKTWWSWKKVRGDEVYYRYSGGKEGQAVHWNGTSGKESIGDKRIRPEDIPSEVKSYFRKLDEVEMLKKRLTDTEALSFIDKLTDFADRLSAPVAGAFE